MHRTHAALALSAVLLATPSALAERSPVSENPTAERPAPAPAYRALDKLLKQFSKEAKQRSPSGPRIATRQEPARWR